MNKHNTDTAIIVLLYVVLLFWDGFAVAVRLLYPDVILKQTMQEVMFFENFQSSCRAF